jgi:2-desacetyl-2-hydroxyethyl bacteriochlorophyllide A dehydrogenase
MKALVWEGPRLMLLREQEKPRATALEVVLRVAFAGICGSELSGYLGHNALRVPPLVMGHEFSGEIIELGEAALEVNPLLKLGQEVTVNPLASCGTCDYCKKNLNHLCPSRKLIGAHRAGAFAEFVSVPAELVHVLPANTSTRVGALAEPVAVAVRIAELAGNVQDQTVLIMGAGPIGLLALQVLGASGAHQVFVADLDTERLEIAATYGAQILNPKSVDVVSTVKETTSGLGAHVAVDAVGAAITRAQCIAATRSGGTVILSGLHEEASQMPAADIIRREITLKGSFAYTPANFAQGLEMLIQNQIQLENVIEAPLEDGGKWFERLIQAPGNISKVLLVPTSS